MGTLLTLPVRRADPADRDDILSMCRENHEENGQFAISPAKVEQMVDKAFTRGGAVIGVMGARGCLESMILMTISQFWYTDDWCLEEVMNYVRPAFRRSTRAKDMILFGKRCSDELRIPLIIGVVANERTKAKMELYRRQLGDPVGGYFIHRPAGAVIQTA